jgi:hypothetical protein
MLGGLGGVHALYSSDSSVEVKAVSIDQPDDGNALPNLQM